MRGFRLARRILCHEHALAGDLGFLPAALQIRTAALLPQPGFLGVHRGLFGRDAGKPGAGIARLRLKGGAAGAHIRIGTGALLQRLLSGEQAALGIRHRQHGITGGIGRIGLILRQRIGLLAQAFQHAGGVGGKRALALHVLPELRHAPLQLLPAGGKARLFPVQFRTRQRQALEARGSFRFRLSQSRQLMGGDGLKARGLGLVAGALRHLAHRRLRGPFGIGQKLRGLPPARPEQHGLVPPHLIRHGAIARRLPGLTAQAVDLATHLAHHILKAQQVLLGCLQAQFRLVATGMEAGNARRLFQNAAARGGLGTHDLADLPCRTSAETGRRWRRRQTAGARHGHARRVR